MSSTQQEKHYKETSPEKTVEKLKEILHKAGIETNEEWSDANEIGTYSLRVTIKGTGYGTNGKGVSKEFALASAYAELFERYENMMLAPVGPSLHSDYPFFFSYDEAYLSSDDLIAQGDSFCKLYFKNRNITETDAKAQKKALLNNQIMDYHFTKKEDNFICLPYYSFKEGRVVKLPKLLLNPYYGSNGMCAGNSREEALVQGLSEIIERIVQRKIFENKLCFPDVPEDYIAKFPYVYELYKKVKAIDGYICKMKDCSCGGKYPVAGLLIIEKNTGRYGIKLGCHPDFGIAMERTLTEATQGRKIAQYVQTSIFDFRNIGINDWVNISNTYKIGYGQYPYQLLGDSFSYQFSPVKDVSELSNAQILEYWINSMLKDGYDILIRDVSVLDFPAYHIIIPGMSEIFDADDMRYRAYNTKQYVMSLLEHTELITKEDYRYIIAILDYFSGSIMENMLTDYYPTWDTVELPCHSFGCDCLYLSAMCSFCIGDYEKAYKKMEKVYFAALREKISSNELERLIGIKYYIQGMLSINNHKKVMKYLNFLFEKEICDFIDNLFVDPMQVIQKQYPSIEKKTTKQYEIWERCVDYLKENQVIKKISQDKLKDCIKKYK